MSGYLLWEASLLIPVLVVFVYLFITVIIKWKDFSSDTSALISLLGLGLVLLRGHIELFFITLTGHGAHASLQEMAEYYTQKANTDSEAKELYRSSASLLEKASAHPLTGLGFFEVRKPVITTITGAVATYMIILIQFRLTEI